VKSQVHFEYAAQEITLTDYVHEVDHAAERIARLERSIDTAIESRPVKMRAVIEALQSLRGIAQISAVSIMAELGKMSRFAHPRQLMGYSGAVARGKPARPLAPQMGDKRGNKLTPFVLSLIHPSSCTALVRRVATGCFGVSARQCPDWHSSELP
jgi:hypothetical protein